MGLLWHNARMKSIHPPLSNWHSGAAHLLHEPMVQNLSELWQVNSLTLGLKALSSNFSVTLLNLADSQAYFDELGFESHQPMFCREVFLSLNDQPVVWARSLCQKNSQRWLPVLDCGAQPLGHRLFDGSLPITRTPFEYAMVAPAHPMLPPEVVTQLPPAGMGARRSVFWWDDEPLLLTECFLPIIKEYL